MIYFYIRFRFWNVASSRDHNASAIKCQQNRTLDGEVLRFDKFSRWPLSAYWIVFFCMLDHPRQYFGGFNTLSKFDNKSLCGCWVIFSNLSGPIVSIWLENSYLGIFFLGPISPRKLSELRGPNCCKFGETTRQSSTLNKFVHISNSLLCIETRDNKGDCGRNLKLHLDFSPSKIYGRNGRNVWVEWSFRDWLIGPNLSYFMTYFPVPISSIMSRVW